MRLRDANSRLTDLLMDRRAEPFRWGVRDCAVMAFDAVQAVTGEDRFSDLRGAYSDAAGAIEHLKRLGGLAGLCAARLGPEIQAGEVQNGDVCLLSRKVCDGETQGHGALGVAWCGSVIAQGESGLVAVEMALALRWWRAA